MVNEKMRQRLELSTLLSGVAIGWPRCHQPRWWDLRQMKESQLQRGAASEARVDVVPPLQFVAFAHLPAEQHDATVAH